MNVIIGATRAIVGLPLPPHSSGGYRLSGPEVECRHPYNRSTLGDDERKSFL